MDTETIYGTWSSYGEKYEINMSDLFSPLIRECGRLVDNYNSDILYIFDNINNHIKEGYSSNSRVEFWFGFRENGVDGFDYIRNRSTNDNNVYYYRGLYKMTIEKNGDKIKATTEKFSNLNDFINDNKHK